MIHSQTLKELTEDEYTLLYAVGDTIFGRIGLEMKVEWLKMLRTDRLIHLLNNINNLKEEYHPLRESLVVKLQQGGF